MLEVNAESKGDKRVLSRGSVEQSSPTPRWSTRPCEYSSPLLRQRRSKSVHWRNVFLPSNENDGLQHRIQLLEGHTTVWGSLKTYTSSQVGLG